VPAIATTLVLGARDAAALCAPPADRLAAAWSPARRETARSHVLSIDPQYGEDRFTRIAAALDAGARGWSDMHVAACRATRIDHSQTDDLLDRRMACLERGRSALAAAGCARRWRAPAAAPVAVR